MTLTPGDFPDFIRPASNVYAVLFDGDIGAITVDLDVGQFASVHVLLYNLDGVSPTTGNYSFRTSSSAGLVEQGWLSCNSVVAQGNSDPSWSLPVVAPILRLGGVGAVTKAMVIGTSQPVRKRLGSDFNAVRKFTGVLGAAAPGGTTVNLLDPAGLSGIGVPVPNCSGYNGEVLYEWDSTIGITANIFMDYLDGNGNLQSTLMFQNFSTTQARLLSGHPYAFVRWRAVTTAANGGVASTLNLTIIPATPAI